jgi:hypothetical protein
VDDRKIVQSLASECTGDTIADNLKNEQTEGGNEKDGERREVTDEEKKEEKEEQGEKRKGREGEGEKLGS